MNRYIETFKGLKFAEKLAILIGVPCIIISTVQTARGWHYTTGMLFLSVMLSLIASSMMVAMDMRMNYFKVRGKYLRIAMIMLFYLAFTAFSFVGNFNALYTETIKDELFTDEVKRTRDYIKAFENGYAGYIDAEKDSVVSNVQRLLQQVRAEILTGTQGLPGCGLKCQQILSQFPDYGLPTPLEPPGSITYQEQMQRITDQVNNDLDDWKSNYDSKYLTLKQDLQADIDSANTIFTSLDDISFFEDKREEYQRVFKETSQMYRDMVSELSGTLGSQIKAEFPEISFNPGEVGTWSFALKYAERNAAEGGLTLTVIILVCLLIDLVVPLVIIFFTPIDVDLQIAEETLENSKQKKLDRHQRKMDREDNFQEEDEYYEDDAYADEGDDNVADQPDPAFIQKWRTR